jgi:hypothetical protein
MASRRDTTRRWVTKFCDLMDWFIDVEDASDERLERTHINGLAANYLAVKLGIAEPNKELPYRHWEWAGPNQDDLPERKAARQQYFRDWRAKAKKHGQLRQTRLKKKVTNENVQRFCDRLQRIKYRAQADPSRADITEFALDSS